ncbi:splicing factor Cactin [Condylostylus longicornis]|uniref:splicing factor Cactin n=1 Tax=Condylostylus longicornis TaxID=2530218 RepID=UPI00244E19D8|nr:splicing factor Cactin [Condylostylus longicornis]
MGKHKKHSKKHDSSANDSSDSNTTQNNEKHENKSVSKKKLKHKDRKERSSSRGRDREKSRHSKKEKEQYKHSLSSRRKSTSSSSSDASNKSYKLLKMLEEKRVQQAIDRKRAREDMKAKETPEEKRARRLREKQMKEAKRRERMGWDNEYQHYTNQDNPFGDAHLTSTFVWHKKLEKEGLDNVAPEAVEALNRRKQLENRLELEKVKKRRIERELERQKREEELILQQRTKEAAQFEEWERQEDQFHLEQARLRSKIRIQDGRAKPIDLLAQYISNSNLEETIEMQMHEPYTFLNGLGVSDLEDLLVDIRVYIELEKGKNSEFWEDMTTIVEDELQKLKKLELGGEYHAKVGRREGIHQSVAKDVANIFRGKTTNQLEELKKKIEAKISGKAEGVDISYWESLLSQLKAHMARARLKDKHQENLKQKLELLKSGDSVLDNQPSDQISNICIKTENIDDADDSSQHSRGISGNSEIGNHGKSEEENAQDILESCFQTYDEGSYSPKYLTKSEIDDNIQIMTEEQDEKNLEKLRYRLIKADEEEQEYTKEELLLQREARKGMNDDEVEFSVETELDSQVYLWSDKYRPRKPRYFNRVHTGFEWNKYNQTHYDMDNPPPKIVQGYKFNIFYPDLIEKNSTPQYFLTPCADNKDFAVLRFHAGPPYEDIAFKIVNREWEFSYKRGFRCQFHNNIFQLWFHFKRYRYRR